MGTTCGQRIVGDLRRVLDDLPDETPVVIAIREDQHFRRLIGELPVVAVQVDIGPVIVLDAKGIS